ncbi:MAG: RNA-directed DNA polymerase [Verrucomicrobia bacterium]|nr:RNA-directed DNA polymerase [Verrucomicrobiota bacterium]
MRLAAKIAHALATAILNGTLTTEGVYKRGAAVLGCRWAWLRPLAKRIIAHFGEGTRPRVFRLERFILANGGFLKACEKHQLTLRPDAHFEPAMCPAAGPPRRWKVPRIRTPGELARWLGVEFNQLLWLADCRTQEQKLPPGPLRHYCYHWQPKRDSSARLIESPKPRLKTIQRQVLHEILDRIPPHAAAHGFRAGRSIRSFVKPHVKREVVLKLDLKDFFPRIARARVLAIFLTAGYPEAVAELLTGLCTNSVPSEVIKACPAATNPLRAREAKQLYQRPHLPQGAPTSPALANLAAYRLDCRLAGLAKAAGARYTRYADDLVFSGGKPFARMVDRFYIQACAIALEEGFEVHTRKTKIMRRSLSQRAAGIVLNEHPNVPRREFDRLKAVLHNCVVHGPASQNRDGVADFRAHLAGRVAHVEVINPARGRKLREGFERIEWE